jgi:hypothetical protein
LRGREVRGRKRSNQRTSRVLFHPLLFRLLHQILHHRISLLHLLLRCYDLRSKVGFFGREVVQFQGEGTEALFEGVVAGGEEGALDFELCVEGGAGEEG